jgi:hypothetical protein
MKAIISYEGHIIKTLEELENYFTCSYTGRLHHVDNEVHTECDTGRYSQVAADDGEIRMCYIDDEYYYRDTLVYVLGIREWCHPSNLSDHGDYVLLHDGQWCHRDYTEYCEYNGEYYLEGELPAPPSIIQNYHESHNHSRKFLRTSLDKSSLYSSKYKTKNYSRFFGIELEVEVDDCSDRNDVAVDVIDILGDAFHCENDGSLDNGFEIISEPMTLNYLREGAYLKRFNSVSESCDVEIHDTCGMHVHVSRNSTVPITWWKVAMMMSKCRDFFVELSERDEDRLTEWAEVVDMEEFLNQNEITRYNVTTSKNPRYKGVRGSRYVGINFNNSDTVEFRLFAGTMDGNLIMSRISFINTLIDFCECHGFSFIRLSKADVLINALKQYAQGKNKVVKFINQYA